MHVLHETFFLFLMYLVANRSNPTFRKLYRNILHMGREHASREKKLTMVNFLIFVQKNVSTIRFQEIKIRP